MVFCWYLMCIRAVESAAICSTFGDVGASKFLNSCDSKEYYQISQQAIKQLRALKLDAKLQLTINGLSRNLQRGHFVGDNTTASVGANTFYDFNRKYPYCSKNKNNRLEFYGFTTAAACIVSSSAYNEDPLLFVAPCALRLDTAEHISSYDFFLIAILSRTDNRRRISFVIGHQPTGIVIIPTCTSLMS